MKLAALRMFNVKRFAARGVAIEGIGDGVNVLCAANEFGKSTSFEALHALFFLPHSSTAGDVRNLRPYSGGNPLVEADVETAAGKYRITKQYYNGGSARVVDMTSGRLIGQAGEAENFIAALVSGGAGGPAGLLWVRQGLTGIERRNRSEEEGEKQVRASLLESVQGEVEAVTGGRRMADVMSRTTNEYALLVTSTGRPKTGGRYAAAVSEMEALSAEHARLSAEVALLHDALDRRTAATKQLAELDNVEDCDAQLAAINQAQAAFDAARAQYDQLRAAETKLDLARERRNAAYAEQQRFLNASAQAQELNAGLQLAQRRRDVAVNRRRDADQAIEQARTSVDVAEQERQAARELLDRLEAAERARDASKRRAEVTKQLRLAEEARQVIEQGEAELAQIIIPAGAIDELAELDIEIVRLRAGRDAARPSIAVHYDAGADGRITMDGAPLADGEERIYDGHAQLVAQGIGVISLRSREAGHEDSDDALEQTEARRRTLLTSMGVADLRLARERQFEAQKIDALLREKRAQLTLLAPDGLPKLRESVAECEPAESDEVEFEADPVATRTALDEAESRYVQANKRLREIEPARTRASDDEIRAETDLAALTAQLAQVAADLGPEAEREGREQALTDSLRPLDRALEGAEAEVAELRASAVDLESAEAALNRARSIAAAATTQINRLRETIAELNGQIGVRSDEAIEEKLAETVDALSAANARVAAFVREVAILHRLSSALETARSKASELYLKPVMTELQPLLGLLFDDISITFDDKTLLPQKISRNGLEEDVERLSGGMREQLSVLTRLAFARLLARDGRAAPVILDDALVYSDDDRIEKMFDALHRQARDQQIVVFSCRQRAFQKLGGNVLQMSDWAPS